MPKKKKKKPSPTYSDTLRTLADSWDANVKLITGLFEKAGLDELRAFWDHNDYGEDFNAWLARVTVFENENGEVYIETEHQNVVWVNGLWKWEDEASIDDDE